MSEQPGIMQAIQQRKLPDAIAAANLAVERLGQVGLEVTARQHVIIQGAILQVLVNSAIERLGSFCTVIVEEAKRIEDLEELTTEELADLLIDHVWSMMDEGEQSTIVEAVIDRLKLAAAAGF